MAIVLAFLIGMPLLAIPQLSERLRGLVLAAQQALRPPELTIPPQPSLPRPDRAANESGAAQRGTTVSMLATDRSQSPASQPSPDGIAASIEALKAQFVDAGVSYMVLERIGTNSVQYRFRFDMPVSEGSAYRKRFQVVRDSPVEAMRQSLTELQRWRVAGREPHLERPTVLLR